MKTSKKVFYIFLFIFVTCLFLTSCIFNETNISDIPVKPLGVPTNVHAESSVNGIRISWNAVEGADSYYLCYSTDSEHCLGKYKVTGTSYNDTDNYPGDIWYYYVYAVKDDMASDISYTVYGQRLLTCGRWSDIQSYQNNYPLVYSDNTQTELVNEENYLDAGYYRYHYFYVYGGTSYTITVADANRNTSWFGSLTPASVNVSYFPAGADSSSITLGSTTSETTIKAELTGYYMFKVLASSSGYYLIYINESSE